MAKKAAAQAEVEMIKVTLVKSANGILKNQKANLEAMGLHKIGNSRTFVDDAWVRAKTAKVSHLFKVAQA